LTNYKNVVKIICIPLIKDFQIFLCKPHLYTSAKFPFYLALYASVGQEPKHIMARWHFCNCSQVLCLGSANTRS